MPPAPAHTPIYPQLLQPNSNVRIVAPSGPVERTSLMEGVQALDFPCHTSDEIYEVDGFWAGSRSHRKYTMQQAIDDPSASAIWCARGGFGLTTILDDISFHALTSHPKWIIGNSDITALLLYLWAHYHLCTIHGPMAARFAQYPQIDIAALHHILTFGPDTRKCTLKPVRAGVATGPLIGGNLTMLAHMMGTLPREFAMGCILLLEDVAEAPYRLERHLIQLSRCGIFRQISGIILGEFTHCSPGSDGVTVETILKRNLSSLPIPVASGYPAAHGARNRPFIHGHPVSLTVTDRSASLVEAYL
ncbi:MAG: LD-carboxypeptidase [Deltaproteobacteria bacterium]|nr:LD-carboxypeptidase [Deltaproteobacteria bacterium]